MKIKSIVEALILSISITCIALVITSEATAAEKFGSMTAEQKAKVRTDEMTEVMVLSPEVAKQLLALNVTKFTRFAENGKQDISKKEKRSKNKKANIEFNTSAKKLVSTEQWKTWNVYFKKKNKR